jgi:thymidylate synthase (FAD)
MKQQAERVTRPIVPEIEQILGTPFPVLDDGFVRVIDYLGCDSSIVQAARVSYGAGTKKRSEDCGLIRYLMRHRHSSPFEMCEVKLHVRVPMDCWRQWIRHRTANVNEYSTRYSIAIEAMQTTAPDAWRTQATDNRQGSAAPLDEAAGRDLSLQEKELQESCRRVYHERIERGVAREQARKDLPLSTYTEAYWKIDLQNLLHFLELRMDPHAQKEIRAYANVIGNEIVAKWVPITWQAFLDYRQNALELSAQEAALIALIARNDGAGATAWAVEMELLARTDKGLKKTLEIQEFEAKLRQMDLPIPWDATDL